MNDSPKKAFQNDPDMPHRPKLHVCASSNCENTFWTDTEERFCERCRKDAEAPPDWLTRTVDRHARLEARVDAVAARTSLSEPHSARIVPVEPAPDSAAAPPSPPALRVFDTGATRDRADNKHDPEGCLSPAVLKRFAAYMYEHQKMSDGPRRASDNWQLGMPRDEYMKSLLRHTLDLWDIHRGTEQEQEMVERLLCAILFNVQGYLFNVLKGKE